MAVKPFPVSVPLVIESPDFHSQFDSCGFSRLISKEATTPPTTPNTTWEKEVIPKPEVSTTRGNLNSSPTAKFAAILARLARAPQMARQRGSLAYS